MEGFDRLVSMVGGVPEEASAALRALAGHERVRARQRRQGVTLAYAGDGAFVAVLLFAGECHGVFVHAASCPRELVMDDLREFRFGWLPTEVVRGQGGVGVAFSGGMPAAAEGFVPTFVTGAGRSAFEGQGTLVPREDL